MCLIRAATGESWNGIMHDNKKDSGVIAVFFWLIFILIAFFIFLNVFIAVIYENFNDLKSSDDTGEVLTLERQDIKQFVNTWSLFNRHGELYMPTKFFPAFLLELPRPLGYKTVEIDLPKLHKIIFCLNIRDHHGTVYFPEVMWALFHSIIGNNDEQVNKCDQTVQILKALKRKYKGLPRGLTPDSLCGNRFIKNEMTITMYLRVRNIQSRWKRFMANQKTSKKLLIEQQASRKDGEKLQSTKDPQVKRESANITGEVVSLLAKGSARKAKHVAKAEEVKTQ